MSAEAQPQRRRPRVDVQRNRATLLEAAQSRFEEFGVGASLEAVAKQAGVGPGTLYRHFPSREALLAAVLQKRSEELEDRRALIARVGDPLEALQQWLRAVEHYLSTYQGLPEPLVAAARAQDPGNPLTVSCHEIITATDEFVRAAQLAGTVRHTVTGYDLFLSAVSIAWTRGVAKPDETALDRLRALVEDGYRQQHQQQ